MAADGPTISSAHPLFRMAWMYAFSAYEQLALSPAPIAASELERALISAATNGWTDAMKKIKERATEIRSVVPFNVAMFRAAPGGHVAAMRLAKESGAIVYGWALTAAAQEGQVEAMWALKAWGAKSFDEALEKAAAGGHLVAMRLLRAWGATNLDCAWQAAKNAEVREQLKIWYAE